MTTPPTDDARFTGLWRAHRRRMLQLALRMLSDLGDAEDVVQEAFARLARTDIAALDDPEGWLVVVTGRLGLDRLRSRRRHPADPWPTIGDTEGGPTSGRGDPVDPADQVALVDSVTLSMHVVLERLSPAERTSFVLHDVFQLPFEEIGTIVGRSTESCRQLASRARRSVRAAAAGRRFVIDDDVGRLVAERFIAACTDGDLDGLLAVLDPAVDGTGDVAGEHLVGADLVAPGILRYLGPAVGPTLLHVPVGERAGVVAVREGRVLALVVLTVGDGRVTHVEAFAGAGPRAALSRVLGAPSA
jgi:RNA polymerase sigma-70 factor (ECF subfamily)